MVDSATQAQYDMTSKQFLEAKAKQRENDINMLALAKLQESKRRCEMVRIDKRTIIMQPLDAKNRQAKLVPPIEEPKEPKVEFVPTRQITDLSPDEIAELEREYPNEANRDLAVKYGVSIGQIQQHACRRKIHKSFAFRSFRARQHALVGRKLTASKHGKS